MNIVIAGDGVFGVYLAKLLVNTTHNIVFIDSSEKTLEYIENYSDLITVNGSATSIEILEQAEVKGADLMISVVHDEKVNIIACMLSKQLGAKKTIARVSSLEYFRPDTQDMFIRCGIDEIVCPERIAVDECVDLISHSAATEVLDFSGKKLSLMLFHLDKNMPYLDTPLKQSGNDIKNDDFKLMLVSRNSKAFQPDNSDVLKAGDYLYAITKPVGKKELLEFAGKEIVDLKNIMIVGGGRIGRMLSKRLEDRNYNIKIVEKDIDKCNLLNDILDKTLVIHGDARDADLLEDEEISGMDAFIAVTNNAETNILTCMLAKRYGVNKVIALMDNLEYIDLAQRVGIEGIINRKLITSSYLTRFTLDSSVKSIKNLIGIDVNAIEICAQQDSYVTKKPIGSLKLPYGVVIGGVIREYESHIATDDFQIRADDLVVVMCFPEAIESTIKLFNKKSIFGF